MKLREILEGVEILNVTGDISVNVCGIVYDSRKAANGNLFIATAGDKSDGHAFIDDAINRGTVAIIHDRPLIHNQKEGIVYVFVKDSRKAMALAAANFYNRPSDRLKIIGVTGTNGKTTTTYIIKSILETWGEKVGLIGTIQYMIGQQIFTATHTTPEAPEFQCLLHEMEKKGCSYVVTEVSSHSLSQRRVDGTRFMSAIFSNLTRDHLDFHITMEEYFRAKERLFHELLDDNGIAVVNQDDPYGKRLISSLKIHRTGLKILSYGLNENADISASAIVNSFDGLSFDVSINGERYSVSSDLMGIPNVYNIISAIAVCTLTGVPEEIIIEGVKNAKPVKGRFEKVDAGQEFLAVIDYAHTSDALERLIYTARGLTKGKVITVFGCGGDRDRGKRPEMGAIATRLSDFVVITSDNPRTEDAEKIIREIESGIVKKNYLIEPDRKEAIKRAVMMADKNDIVLVAGKGHEEYQEINGQRFPFSDRQVMEEIISQFIRR